MVRKVKPQPKNKQELMTVLQAEWKKITLEVIKTLYKSMQK